MEEKFIKSNIPIYSIGFVFLIYSIIFSMYTLFDILIASVLSVIIYFILSKIIPPKKIMVEVNVDTGNKQADEIIKNIQEKIKQIENLNKSLEDTNINKDILEIKETSYKIFDFVNKNPDKARTLRTFIDYYLPTTIELLENYLEIKSQNIKENNIEQTLSKIENAIKTIKEAFTKKLDDLFLDKALDISSEIAVLKGVLEKEGLKEGNFNIKK